jgi:hypothetical protein
MAVDGLNERALLNKSLANSGNSLLSMFLRTLVTSCMPCSLVDRFNKIYTNVSLA